MAEPIPKHIVAIVKKEYLPLSSAERNNLVERLTISRDHYEREVLKLAEVRKIIYRMFEEKYNDGTSIAVLSRHYNASLAGQNTQISMHIKRCLFKALEADRLKNPKLATKYLTEAELRHLVIYHKDVENYLVSTNGVQLSLNFLNNIKKIHNLLFRNLYKLVANTVSKHYSSVHGDIIMYDDVFHEGIIAAKEGIHKFKPSNDVLNQYYNYMLKLVRAEVGKYISENSRVVALPRNSQTIDRYGPIKEALEQVGYSDFDKVALLANKINHDRKMASRGRKLRRDELYTADEVHKLVSCFQGVLSLDLELEPADLSDSGGLLGDKIPSDNILQDETYDKIHNTDVVLNVLSEYCNNTQEFQLMVIRWGLISGKKTGLQETADAYRNEFRKPMNKGKVNILEHRIIRRLRAGLENGDDRLKLVMESYRSIEGRN
jgi:hypothetical protein